MPPEPCSCREDCTAHTFDFWSDRLLQCATEEGVEVTLLDLGTSNLRKSGLRCLSLLLDLSRSDLLKVTL